MFRVLHKKGITGGLLEAVKSFYRNSITGVRVGHKTGELFEERGELIQRCVM